jgi:glycerol-3-phosphate O-acyltransferase
MPLKYRKEQYPFVIPDLKDWPIAQLTKDKEAFIEQLTAFCKERVHLLTDSKISAEIERTMYLEQKRMKEEPWRLDPASEKKFWKQIQKDLLKQPVDSSKIDLTQWNDELLERIIKQYANEIAGHFNIKTYWFARRVLTTAFTILLNAASPKNVFNNVFQMRHKLQERIQTVGEVEHIRGLLDKGTIVFVPTHFSNLDSILIGLSLDFVGLPAFSYGAGLNLFNSGAVAFFMNRLGAYRLDRRKKSKIYIETLKGYSNLSMERGVHSLFFPGGTRSRSGQVENKLKLGLMSTVIEAQRRLYESGKDEKIYVVPLLLGYHFVLEAKSLIEQHLKKTGKEQYYVKDEYRSNFKILQFIWRFFRQSSEVVLSFGKPLDVLGNFVDENGNSIDKHGNAIDTKDYFLSGGKVQADLQRESEYTKILASRVIERFYSENIALTSHVVAFTAFNLFKNKHPELDIYDLLRVSYKEVVFEIAEFHEAVKAVQKVILALEKEGKIKVSPNVSGTIDNLIENGLANLGGYHDRKPLFKHRRTGKYMTQDLKLLLYYHNHLMGYDIERRV